MPGGTPGTLILIALCLAGAAFCLNHVAWGGPWTFTQVLWLIAGVLLLCVGVVLAALLIAARFG